MTTIGTLFFSAVRLSLFDGHLQQTQVDGLNAIVNTWNDFYPIEDPRKLGYCLATAYHETAHTMQPVEEIGHGRGHRYGLPDHGTGKTYYGRGYVQLTWLVNYEKMGKLLNIDLVWHPELALRPDVAAKIMFQGMILGVFTGKKLSYYFRTDLENDEEDPVNARRIINGLDKAEDIAGYYRLFMAALNLPRLVA